MSAPAAPAPVQVLDRRRVYIFLTHAGLLLGAMDFVVLFGAINYDNALGYLLAFLLGGLVLVTMLHTYRNLAGLRFTGVRASPVFVGDNAEFECMFDHAARLPRLRIALCAWPRGAARESRRQLQLTETVFDLAPAASGGAVARVAALRRGWLALERIRIRSVYPLGFLRAWAYFDSAARCLVYPAPRGALPLPRTPSGSDGEQRSQVAGTDEFNGLRPYVAGDPLRAIAWKSLAQERDLMIKRFHGYGAERVRLTWGAVASLGHTEARLAQLCKWVLEASRLGLTYAVELADETIDYGCGHRHRERCLRALALYGLEP